MPQPSDKFVVWGVNKGERWTVAASLLRLEAVGETKHYYIEEGGGRMKKRTAWSGLFRDKGEACKRMAEVAAVEVGHIGFIKLK